MNVLEWLSGNIEIAFPFREKTAVPFALFADLKISTPQEFDTDYYLASLSYDKPTDIYSLTFQSNANPDRVITGQLARLAPDGSSRIFKKQVIKVDRSEGNDCWRVAVFKPGPLWDDPTWEGSHGDTWTENWNYSQAAVEFSLVNTGSRTIRRVVIKDPYTQVAGGRYGIKVSTVNDYSQKVEGFFTIEIVQDVPLAYRYLSPTSPAGIYSDILLFAADPYSSDVILNNYNPITTLYDIPAMTIRFQRGQAGLESGQTFKVAAIPDPKYWKGDRKQKLVGGYNITLQNVNDIFSLEATEGSCSISYQPNSGAGYAPISELNTMGKYIKSINGSPPNSEGNFSIVGATHLRVTVPEIDQQPIPATIQLLNDGLPCCGCENYRNVSQAILLRHQNISGIQLPDVNVIITQAQATFTPKYGIVSVRDPVFVAPNKIRLTVINRSNMAAGAVSSLKPYIFNYAAYPPGVGATPGTPSVAQREGLFAPPRALTSIGPNSGGGSPVQASDWTTVNANEVFLWYYSVTGAKEAVPANTIYNDWFVVFNNLLPYSTNYFYLAFNPNLNNALDVVALPSLFIYTYTCFGGVFSKMGEALYYKGSVAKSYSGPMDISFQNTSLTTLG